ncbi:MAG: hypothetical protein AB7G06_05750 [Bdellovibrionales bacterium]
MKVFNTCARLCAMIAIVLVMSAGMALAANKFGGNDYTGGAPTVMQDAGSKMDCCCKNMTKGMPCCEDMDCCKGGQCCKNESCCADCKDGTCPLPAKGKKGRSCCDKEE